MDISVYVAYGILALSFMIILALAIYASKGKMYVLQPDGYSAKLGEYNLCLIDKNSRRIWARVIKGEIIVETIHDLLRFEPNQTWCEMNGHSLTFKRSSGDAFIYWEKDLSVYHER